ncbi:MAG: DUF4435 domain-containing protein [Candidatus Methanomethylophilus sp.]|nr:DUF4435 domain-containing protein [Methanomethylophilus sp.]MDD3232759.1 DUF4435 domain-containing protein [Methanomethylophilus sp.]MDD4221807.1 DUF4435 domain-containing protein [Methanomethylophilus sp.]MDD4668603.1 DUF4435 domain-containing protein [Methanomethylophilus sp.]
MRTDLFSANDLANEISMMRAAYRGTVLVVEGVTDSRLYAKYTDKDRVRIIIAHSKDNVKRAVTECQRRHDPAVLGIADRDLDSMIGRRTDPPVFLTDRHDMESMIICSSALDDVLTEYGDREALEKFEAKYGPVREAVGRAACPVGLLMYISYRQGMNLSFKDLDHTEFVDGHSLSVDLSRLISQVYSQSMNQMYSKPAVADSVRSLMKQLKDPWDAVRGHDAVAVLAIGLRSAFGSYNAKGIREGELSGALRLTYDYEYFKKTMLYAATDAWSRERGVALWLTRRFL